MTIILKMLNKKSKVLILIILIQKYFSYSINLARNEIYYSSLPGCIYILIDTTNL